MNRYRGRAGSKVRLHLVEGTVIEGVTRKDATGEGYWPIAGLTGIAPYEVREVDYIAAPRPLDVFINGAALYAANNDYHHVWVKSGGKWYTGNRYGTVTWDEILDLCAKWNMRLWKLTDPGLKVYQP